MPRKRQRRVSNFDPTLSKGIIVILLIVLALIITLSFFEKAGTIGIILNEWVLAFLFGSMRFAIPIIIIILAWFILKDDSYAYRPTHGIGAILFFLTLSSLMHMNFDVGDMWHQAIEGHGGGVFGMLAWPLKSYLGTVAAGLLLIALATISIILLFNTAIFNFLSLHKILVSRLGAFGNAILRQEAKTDNNKYEDEDDDADDFPSERRFTSRNIEIEVGDENDLYEYDSNIKDEEDNKYDEGIPKMPKSKIHIVKAVDEIPDWAKYVVIKPLPEIYLLKTNKSKPTSGDIKSNATIIQNTLFEFGIEVGMGEIRVGPTVTQYSLKPAKGVKISKITSLSNDLALALAAHPIRIEAPIPGKSLVGIEVPNEKTSVVSFKELLQSSEFSSRPHNMMITLGKDVGGKIWMADLPKMPHMLIAGATGSGKTVCMNTLIMSLLFQNTAETLRFIMVDPKRVELTLYNGIPHLLTPVITNSQDTVNALKWTIAEMDRRFELLAKAGNRDIDTYNQSHPQTKIPYLVFVIDELADLMATASNEVEAGIIRIAQMARAVGIHLLVATQRPSVDVITGLMKANIPTRVAFSVASIIDSRTILDVAGAEKLLGRGDMLFSSAELSKPVRIQGAFITEDEMKHVVKYLKGGTRPVYDESITKKQGGGTTNMFGGPADDQDPLYEDAKGAIFEAEKASASFLQRRLRIGYARAARILDELEEAGVIGPSDGAKPREILVTGREISSTMGMGQEYNVYDSDVDSEEDVNNEDFEIGDYEEEDNELEDVGDDDLEEKSDTVIHLEHEDNLLDEDLDKDDVDEMEKPDRRVMFYR